MADILNDGIPLDVIESTLSKYSPTVYDNVTKHNALLHNLRERGHIKSVDGGRSYIETISYSNNHNARFMSLRDDIPMDVANVFTHAEFFFRFAQIPIGIWMDEELMNEGEAKLYDIMDTRTKNGMAEFDKMFAAALYNETAIDYSIDGIPMIVADDPEVGIVGGIDRSLKDGDVFINAWWMNQIENCSAEFGLADGVPPTGDQLEKAMNLLWQKCEIFKDHPTSIYASTDMFNLYREWLISKRIDVSKNKVGDLEFTTLEFMGTPVYRDPYCPARHMYFLNEEFIHLRAHKKMMFKFQKAREPYNKYMHVIPLTFWGNFTVSNCQKQGVLFYNPSDSAAK